MLSMRKYETIDSEMVSQIPELEEVLVFKLSDIELLKVKTTRN